MKKEYIKPITELIDTKTENLLASHSLDHADSKPGFMFDDEMDEKDGMELYPSPHNLWDD
jgi:hypothetical protein